MTRVILFFVAVVITVICFPLLSGDNANAIGVAGTLIGICLGFLLNSLVVIGEKSAQNKSLWAFLRQEIDYCGSQAKVYISNGVDLPAYRLPTKSYSEALPVLLKEGQIGNDEDIQKIIRFFDAAEQFNRSLDHAEALKLERAGRDATKELNRCKLKAEKIEADKGEYFLEASQVVKGK